jgi:hypothetical protein
MNWELSAGCVKKAAAAAAFLAVLGASSGASAVSFSGSYQVNALSSDPGLVIQTQELADPLNFVLANPGDWYSVDLFKIWTDEGDVGNDDQVPAPISVDFSFSAPPSSGAVTGITVGGGLLFQEGRVEWDGPEIISFGNGGQLKVRLSDEDFNWGIFGLSEGYKHGATVKAKFELISNSVAVPLPASLPQVAA